MEMSQGLAPAFEQGSEQQPTPQMERATPEFADTDDDVSGSEGVGQTPATSVTDPAPRERQTYADDSSTTERPAVRPISEGPRGDDPLARYLEPGAQALGDDFPPELLHEAGVTREVAIREFGNMAGLQKALADRDRLLLQRGYQAQGIPQFQPPPLGAQPMGLPLQAPNQFGQFQQQPQQWGQPQPQQWGQPQNQWGQQQPPQQQLPQQQQPYGQQPGQQPGSPFAPLNQQDLAPFMAQLEFGEDWDDASKDMLTKLNTFHATQHAQTQRHNQFLQNAVTQMVEFVVGNQQNQVIQQYDDYFQSLGKEWHGVFGVGTRSELNPQSQEYRERSRLVQAAEALKFGYQSAGFQPPSLRTLMKKALGAEFGERQTTLVRQQLQGQVDQRRKQTIARPTHTRGTARTGDETAAQKINALFRARGLPVAANEDPDPEV